MNALNLRETERKVGLKKTAIYRFIAAGQFPQPIKIGRASRWLESELDAFLLERANEREQGKGRA